MEAVGDPDRQVDAGHVLEGLRVEQNEVAPIGLRVVDEAHGDSLVLTGVGTGRYEHELADRAPRAERLEVRAPRREVVLEHRVHGVELARAGHRQAGRVAVPVSAPGQTLVDARELLAAVIGREFAPYVLQAAFYLQDLAKWVRSLSDEQRAAIAKWVVYATAIAGVIMLLPAIQGAASLMNLIIVTSMGGTRSELLQVGKIFLGTLVGTIAGTAVMFISCGGFSLFK